MKMMALRSMVLGAILIAGAQVPVQAASPITNAFMANVKPNVDFLDRSARLASDRSSNPALKAYARSGSADAIRTAELLNGVVPAVQPSEVAAADASALMTGRSVSVDGPTGGIGQAANGRQPLGEADLATLTTLSGRKFTDAFWLKQVDALSQLRADYQAYLDDGDDAAVIALAKNELASVERRLVALSKI